MTVRIGTAGWSIPRAVAAAFPEGGSGLERYAARFDAVEINTSFYRPHRRATYERWAASVPARFRFAVKIPKTVTHAARLADCRDLLAAFAEGVTGLGDRRGPSLVQLPPSLAFDADGVRDFFGVLGETLPGPAVCEPRHASWFDGAADALLAELKVARVAADPALHPGAGAPGGWNGFAYYRLHGSPRVYWSAYDAAAIDRIARAARPADWVIFDNTASGAAAADALALQARLSAASAAGGSPN